MKRQTLIPFGFLLAALSPSAMGATTFANDPNSLALANWDSWIAESATVTNGLSQGSAATTSGSILINSSEVTTDILQAYSDESFTGLGFNPDSYYVHNGAFQWNATVSLASTVEFVRVSYSLIASGPSPSVAFANAPSMAGATVIDSGSYSDASSLVFYTDFQLDTATNTLATSFGDIVPPGFYAGSFSSVDAIQIEGFNIAPSPVPEPSAAVLGLCAGVFLLRRRR